MIFYHCWLTQIKEVRDKSSRFYEKPASVLFSIKIAWANSDRSRDPPFKTGNQNLIRMAEFLGERIELKHEDPCIGWVNKMG